MKKNINTSYPTLFVYIFLMIALIVDLIKNFKEINTLETTKIIILILVLLLGIISFKK
ncbi:hypothetical protein ACSVH5_12525 [Flavobacterium sp. RSSA_27]|uniref:hypothetical protein n=1 Tax=Flavobacterium sp. RSSA_27 TaxID=3447667 RepID=UPI003F2A1A14